MNEVTQLDKLKLGPANAVAPIVLFLLILGISLGVYLEKIELFRLGTFVDDASYVILAQSIVFSEQYGLIHLNGEIQPSRYPFGFPLLLAPLAGLAPDRLDHFKLASLAATLMNTCLLFWGWPYLSRNRSRWWGLAVSSLYSLAVLTCLQTRMVMAEPVFTAYVLAALILTEKCSAARRASILSLMALGFVSTFTVFIRTIGIIVPAIAWLRCNRLFSTKSPRNSIYMGIGAAALLVLVISFTPITFRECVPYEYISQLLDPHAWGQTQIAQDSLLSRLAPSFVRYAEAYIHLWFILPGVESLARFLRSYMESRSIDLLIGFGIFSLILIGHLRSFRGRGLRAGIVGFELSYFAIVLVWPWQSERFLYPIYPLLLVHFLWGIQIVIESISFLKFIPTALIQIGSALVVMILVGWMVGNGIKLGLNDYGALDFVRDFSVGATWLRDNTPRSAVVLTYYPQIIYLYSQRKTAELGDGLTSIEFIEEFLPPRDIDYILTGPELKWGPRGILSYDHFTADIFLPLLHRMTEAGQLRVVFSDTVQMVTVFEVPAGPLNPSGATDAEP